MRIKNSLIYGVGRNDADHPVWSREFFDGKITGRIVCPYYMSWRGMLQRCYSERYQKRQPTYIGCSVVPEWLKFSAYMEWMKKQPWQGNTLDKDILLRGNKIYGTDTCVFVSISLNTFIIDCGKSRGEWLIGASWKKDSNKFISHCQNPFSGKKEYLGYFQSQESAHEAWRRRKHEHACRYADMQTDPRIAAALRERYLPGKEFN